MPNKHGVDVGGESSCSQRQITEGEKFPNQARKHMSKLTLDNDVIHAGQGVVYWC